MTAYDADGYDDYYADEFDGEPECTHCGGDGWDECADPLQCCASKHYSNEWEQYCPCRACNGTGLRSQQWIF